MARPSVVPPIQHPSATDTGRPVVQMGRAQTTQAVDADPAVECERLVHRCDQSPQPGTLVGHRFSLPCSYAQARLKEQAKERQQTELAELKSVAAQQNAAWMQFEQKRQDKLEVANAAKAATRAEAGAKRRLAMLSLASPNGRATDDNLMKLGKGSKKQKAGSKSKGGAACSKCARSPAYSVAHRARSRPACSPACSGLGETGESSRRLDAEERLWWRPGACPKCPTPPRLTK